MTEFGIVKLHEMLKNGEITSRDLIDESLKKSHELNEKCNAFVTIMDDVKEMPVTEDLLSGIPYGIKDNYSTKDILSTGSSNTLKDYVPFFDATAVANLKKHGAVGVNKTALDEFSNKLSPALKEMYVAKYRDNKPFIEFYNVVAPTGYIMALNKELNALVSKIERPKQRLYA